MTTCRYTWLDHDFRPAAPGWRIVYLDLEADDPERPFRTYDLAGWMTQVESRVDEWHVDTDPRPRADRERRVVPVDVVDGVLEDATEARNFWTVLGPSSPDPTAEQARTEIEKRKAGTP